MPQDNKYGTITVEREPGNPFTDDEPVFIIRGRDAAAVSAIRSYAMSAHYAGAKQDHVRSVYERADEVKQWQTDNKDKVKVPD